MNRTAQTNDSHRANLLTFLMDGSHETTQSNLGRMTSDTRHDDKENISMQSMNQSSEANMIKDGTEIESIEAFARNPIMDRVQNALRAQLLNTRDRIKRELLEKQDDFRDAKKDREDCGVELYGMQRQLAQLQDNFDEMYAKHVELMKKVRADEDKSSKMIDVLSTRKDEQRFQQEKASKREAEFKEVDESLKQAKRFNQETKNEITVTKRVAAKVEETAKGKEKDKETQDMYIDGLCQEIRHLEVDIKSVNKQLSIQKGLTSEADKVTTDVSTDLEALSFEKKQLIQQWKSSIIALGRRDQGLAAALEALRKTQNSTKDYSNEFIGLKRNLNTLITERDSKTFDRDKIQSEISFIDGDIEKVHAEEETIAGQFEILSSTVTKTHEEEVKTAREAKKYLSDLSAIVHKIETVSKERRELEEKIDATKDEQATISQEVRNVVKLEKAVARKIHDKEIEGGEVENELARIRIDTLNTSVHCSQLEKKLDSENHGLDERDKEIAGHEAAIRKSHIEIESKMKKVDRLNRKYEQMLDGVEEEEPLGPLEVEIKSLKKSIQEKNDRARALQDEWVKGQSKLIETMNKAENLQMEQRQKIATITILKQKRLRLLQNIHSNEAAQKVIDSRVKAMHADISRLNELIGKYFRMQSDLSNEKALKQMEFKEEIKELEAKALEIEIKISGARATKEETLQKILDAEKEILIWEKKIKLEKETQAALNSSEHAIEINGMEKEIHRMKHRLESMKRDQEKIMREMEMAIHKREDIAIKYQNAKSGGADCTNTATIADVRKRKTALARQQKENEVEIAEQKEKFIEVEKKLTKCQNEVSAIVDEVEREKNMSETYQSVMNKDLFQKQRLLTRTARLHDLLKKYQHLDESKEVLDHEKEQFAVEKKLATAKSKLKGLTNSVSGLRIKYKEYDEVFGRVYTLAEDIDKE